MVYNKIIRYLQIQTGWGAHNLDDEKSHKKKIAHKNMKFRYAVGGKLGEIENRGLRMNVFNPYFFVLTQPSQMKMIELISANENNSPWIV